MDFMESVRVVQSHQGQDTKVRAVWGRGDMSAPREEVGVVLDPQTSDYDI